MRGIASAQRTSDRQLAPSSPLNNYRHLLHPRTPAHVSPPAPLLPLRSASRRVAISHTIALPPLTPAFSHAHPLPRHTPHHMHHQPRGPSTPHPPTHAPLLFSALHLPPAPTPYLPLQSPNSPPPHLLPLHCPASLPPSLPPHALGGHQPGAHEQPTGRHARDHVKKCEKCGVAEPGLTD